MKMKMLPEILHECSPHQIIYWAMIKAKLSEKKNGKTSASARYTNMCISDIK